MKHIVKFISEHLHTPKNTKAFVIIKPGFLDYEDEIFEYINDNGFEMIDHTNKQQLSDAQIHELYKMHKGEDFYDDLCEYMKGYIIAAIFTYEGSDDPIKKMDKIKNHFRKKYGEDEMRNVMHSSDSMKNVLREAKIIFN